MAATTTRVDQPRSTIVFPLSPSLWCTFPPGLSFFSFPLSRNQIAFVAEAENKNGEFIKHIIHLITGEKL